MYYPALTTAALFTAIIIEDAITRKSSNFIKHLFLGFISVGLMVYLSMNKAEFVAWGLLIIPMFIIFLSFISLKSNTSEKSGCRRPPLTPSVTSQEPVLTGHTIQLPVSPSTPSSSTVTPSSDSCTVHTN